METSGRCPEGIRRHYNEVEDQVVNCLPSYAAHKVLGRPEQGVRYRKDRNSGRRRDNHPKDGSHKYRAQAFTKARAHNNGKKWEDWEDQYLLMNPHLESLTEKALVLGRTYRSAEDRRSQLLRELDK